MTKIHDCNQHTAQELITDAVFKGVNKQIFTTPLFLFGYVVAKSDEDLFNMTKWLNKMGDWCTFVPNLECNFSLTYLQWISLSCVMSWPITRSHHSIPIGRFIKRGHFVDGPTKDVVGLLLVRINKDLPVGKYPKHTDTFINQFADSKG